ncbi:hypothetical protein SAMN04489867_1579 [Pedococcus dokdonensis]|uniref:Uncharacterized protein n=1 Tax=Pedococcus dokdonensis TaxID=443156 RepID=A0A1H0QES1_9MICO|nr:hypothetical protein [Pedococcus dokdonensis]SDP15832.1 hypothetical protein SAMN04489867_1579 [Pedococcus dokdonensis]
MDVTSFHKLRLAVQENANPADSALATHLRHTLQAALTSSRLFAEVELGHTDDPDQLVIGVCRCADGVLPWEAGMGVERLWQTVSADVPWEAHTVSCTDSLMDFESAVTVDDKGRYITVHLVAEPSEATKTLQAAQAAEAERAAELAEAQAADEAQSTVQPLDDQSVGVLRS